VAAAVKGLVRACTAVLCYYIHRQAPASDAGKCPDGIRRAARQQGTNPTRSPAPLARALH